MGVLAALPGVLLPQQGIYSMYACWTKRAGAAAGEQGGTAAARAAGALLRSTMRPAGHAVADTQLRLEPQESRKSGTGLTGPPRAAFIPAPVWRLLVHSHRSIKHCRLGLPAACCLAHPPLLVGLGAAWPKATLARAAHIADASSQMRSPWGSPRRAPPSPPATTADASPPFEPGGSDTSSLLGDVFDLSPELPPMGALGSLGLPAAVETPAVASGGDVDLFLANLKSKYRLHPTLPPLISAPAAPLAAEVPAAACSASTVRVHVRVTSSLGNSELAAPPPWQQVGTDDGCILPWVPCIAPAGDFLLPPSLEAGLIHGSANEAGPCPGTEAADAVLAEGLPSPPVQQQEQESPAQPAAAPIPTVAPQAATSAPNQEEQQLGQAPHEEQQRRQQQWLLAEQECMLSAEMSAELMALETLQHQLIEQSRPQPLERQPQLQNAEQAAAITNPSGEADATAGAEEQAGHGSPPPQQQRQQQQQCELLGSAHASMPPLPPQAEQLEWSSLHTLLVQRGFPGLLPADADADRQPDPATLFTALHSLLQEQARSTSHQQRLAEAAQAAARREGALVASLTVAARQHLGAAATPDLPCCLPRHDRGPDVPDVAVSSPGPRAHRHTGGLRQPPGAAAGGQVRTALVAMPPTLGRYIE